ncbi:MAG: LytS/YehU family sensor histidine kinase [Cryomorphaceae bacterium]|jgi:LytS/YehU family sensor histidine kinase
MCRALIIGSNGTIGSALSNLMATQYELHTLSQAETDYSDSSLCSLSAQLNSKGDFHTIICCIGTLHNNLVTPEKRLSHITQDALSEYFRINTILPALCMKAFSSLLSKA